MTQFRIPNDTGRYILETLRFAPATARELSRHMRRRSDYRYWIARLLQCGDVIRTGSGKKGSPFVYRVPS